MSQAVVCKPIASASPGVHQLSFSSQWQNNLRKQLHGERVYFGSLFHGKGKRMTGPAPATSSASPLYGLFTDQWTGKQKIEAGTTGELWPIKPAPPVIHFLLKTSHNPSTTICWRPSAQLHEPMENIAHVIHNRELAWNTDHLDILTNRIRLHFDRIPSVSLHAKA